MNATLLLGLAGATMLGCATQSEPDPLKGVREAERTIRADSAALADLPPATIDGAPVLWEELRPELLEAAGSVILEEVALSRALRREVAALGLTIGEAEIDREREYLVQGMREAGFAEQAEQGAAFRRVLASRGLGDRRLGALLERNAMLRAVAGRNILIPSEEVQEAFEVMYGPKCQVRLIVTEDLESASEAMASLEALESLDAAAFAREARRSSVDPSAKQGGRIEALSLADSRYPASLRASVRILEPGGLSPVFSLDERFAVAYLEGVVQGSGATIDEVWEECEGMVRRRKERQAMEMLADQLLRRSSIQIADPALRWSWETRTQAQ